MRSKKQYYIRTFGCQMNVHDSEQMEQLLLNEGFCATGDDKSADLIIVNTCSIREKAEQKVYSILGRYRGLKQARPDLIIGVGGCMAQQQGTDLFARAPHLDFVFGTHTIHRLPEMIKEVERNRRRLVDTCFRDSVQSIGIVAPPRGGSVSSFVTIMQGCNNFCSFCVVPYVRGREESREISDIVSEIEALTRHGVKEVILLGQNVNSYGNTLNNGANFPLLLKEINGVDGIKRIRFTTSHPKDLSDDLIKCFAVLDKVCEHIHLPVQSGSDTMLRRMNRRYTAGDYLRKVEKLREACPRISISTDIIVGFPGESEEDFQKTIDLMEKVRFDSSFSFKYSVRPGTMAERYDDRIPESVKRDRLMKVQKLQERYTLEGNEALKGCVEDILVEGLSKNSSADVTGRTRTNRIVNFPGGTGLIGERVYVRIQNTYIHSLRGELVEKERNWQC
jgi:tRNA-2-methylthio-N6-dimethylallyladenosine synthase